MPTCIALLRGINVGGHGKLAMSDLRDLAESLGLRSARTLLQSGNLVFQADRRSADALERLLETQTQKRLGLSIDYLVRTAAEWDSIVAANPFPKEAASDPSHLVVMFLKAAPEPAAVKSLQATIQGPEILRAAGRQLYIVYAAGIGASKLTGALIEKRLGLRGTARNWNTVLKLAGLVGG